MSYPYTLTPFLLKQIHIYEIYIKILVFAFTTSNWVGLNDLECPWVLRKSADRCERVQWYEMLSHNGQFGNASNILSILLEILPSLEPQDACVLFGKRCFGDLGELESLVGRYETENLLIFTVSLHRAQALLCLAVILYEKIASNGKVKEIYDLALSYHIVAGELPAIIFPDGRPSLAHLRLKIQEVSFKIFEKRILFIDHPSEFLDIPVRDFPVSLLQSDPRCYTTCYMQALLRSFYGYTYADDSFKSTRLSDIQNLYCGDLIGFIRTCDLQCTLLALQTLGWSFHFEQAPLSSALDCFMMSRYSPRAFPESLRSMDLSLMQGQIRDMMGHALPCENLDCDSRRYKTLDKNNTANLESFDIPLYQWSMYWNLMALDLTLEAPHPPSGYSDLQLILIKKCLPEHVYGFDLIKTAYSILNTKYWKSESDIERRSPSLGSRKSGISMEKEILAKNSKPDEVTHRRRNDDAQVLPKR